MSRSTAPLLLTLLAACGPGPDASVDRGGLGSLDDGANLPAIPAPESERESEPAEPACPPDVSECRFERYNLDVRVGDRFVLANFVERCDGDAGTDFEFAYEDDTLWNLAAFNANAVVEIVEADLDDGNHGDGEYRLLLVDTEGRELDHATIRIDHDDDSDVRSGDDIAPAPYSERCDPAGAPDPVDGDDDPSGDDDDPTGDIDATSGRDDPAGDDCGADCV